MSGAPGIRRLYHLSGGEREERLARLRDALAAEGAVVFAYVFGSFTEERAFEDVDIAVLLDPGAAATDDALSAQLRLAARLENAAGLPVDLVLLNDAPLGLRAAALAGRLLDSRDEARRLAFVERTGFERMDTAFLRHQSLRDLLVRGASGADRRTP